MSTDTTSTGRAAFAAQTAIGIALATIIILAWLATHFALIYGPSPIEGGVVATVAAILFASWLSVGLFIIAHDAMHGSLAPGRRAINRAFGSIGLGLYGAFPYDHLRTEHFKHHTHVGTDGDPDFDADHPRALLPWFVTFMRRYSTWRQPAYFAVGSILHVAVFSADPVRVVMFWMLPALLSAFQLFYFGTYLPHRLEDEPFADEHRSRTQSWPWLVTLLTCFHFGRHHEHHVAPHVPWWRLPRVKL
jgi:beta-carotene/zeaxanthin 4-ketolase